MNTYYIFTHSTFIIYHKYYSNHINKADRIFTVSRNCLHFEIRITRSILQVIKLLHIQTQVHLTYTYISEYKLISKKLKTYSIST